MRNENLTKLTLAGMFAALAFCCFSYLRIEIPMGLGLTGKIYIGHAFIILSALVLGAKYGALSGAIGLTLADVLAGYTTSAPPTFVAKFLLGWSVAFLAHRAMRLADAAPEQRNRVIVAAAVGGVYRQRADGTPDPLRLQVLCPRLRVPGGLRERRQLRRIHGRQRYSVGDGGRPSVQSAPDRRPAESPAGLILKSHKHNIESPAGPVARRGFLC